MKIIKTVLLLLFLIFVCPIGQNSYEESLGDNFFGFPKIWKVENKRIKVSVFSVTSLRPSRMRQKDFKTDDFLFVVFVNDPIKVASIVKTLCQTQFAKTERKGTDLNYKFEFLDGENAIVIFYADSAGAVEKMGCETVYVQSNGLKNWLSTFWESIVDNIYLKEEKVTDRSK